MTQLKVLGCSGGIGGARRTTCLKVGSHTLIDAGSGAMDLSLDELRDMDQVFITHSHLDHVMSIALIADAVGGLRDRPLAVYALAQTIQVLQRDLFNNRLWPDFTKIPSTQSPYVTFHTVTVGDVIACDGFAVEVLPAQHSVPAAGYCVHGAATALAFSGDTGACPAFWARLNEVEGLQAVLVETSFQNAEAALALESGHFTPKTLMECLRTFRTDCNLYISHLKPGEEDAIMQEFGTEDSGRRVLKLEQGQVFELI